MSSDVDGPILVLNCGSSSIKLALFDPQQLRTEKQSPLWSASVAGIGSSGASIASAGQPARPLELDPAHPYQDALDVVRAYVERRCDGRMPATVAHRVVHGGSRYTRPVVIDRNVYAKLAALIPLAPLHQPYALQAIDYLLEREPGLKQVACFDTAFHSTLPEAEQMLPLPRDFWERGVRRYGFHGLSYEYMAFALDRRHGALARGRTVVAHLGSGASLCAMLHGRSVATTMGFSALDGLMMGTRCGALDAGVVLHLLEAEGLSVRQVSDLLYHRSGLLGVSGLSASPLPLLAAESTDPQSRAALALYVRRIVREIGALVAVLGGVDLIAFTAGVGENSAEIRARICAALAWLGLDLDAAANRANAPTISSPNSLVHVAVEPTNEEWVAARHARDLLAHMPVEGPTLVAQ